MVPRVGLEPTRLAAPDFESGTSTNSITEARSFTLSMNGNDRSNDFNQSHRLAPKVPKSTD